MKNKILLLLTLFILTACQTGADKAGHFVADCSYITNEDSSVDLHCKRLDGAPLPDTPIVTQNATATPTGVTTAIPTAVPSATATQPPASANLFKDGGFEGPYTSRVNVDGFEHTTPIYWQPFYCDGCPAYRQGDGNPTGLKLGRPEFKPASQDNDALRVHSGKDAGEYFGFYRAINGGFYQTVNTVPGAQCTVSAYVQSWSGFDGDKDPHLSHLVTEDDKANSVWFILVDLGGGTNAFSGNLLSSRAFGYEDGIYDKWSQISFSFVATGAKTTVFFDNLRLWPARNNNNYIDDAVMVCSNAPNPTSAPPATATAVAPPVSPVPSATPTGGATPTQVPPTTPHDEYPIYNDDIDAIYQVINLAGLKKHSTRVITDSNLVFPGYAYADEMRVLCVVQESLDLDWASTQPCKPEPTIWFVIRQASKVYARQLEGPQGN